MITVRELIAQLSALPPDYRVQVEGCDCILDATEASVQSSNVLVGSRYVVADVVMIGTE